MDSAYDRKFQEMKKYIPFLESMIKRLESTSSVSASNPRQAQLDKIRSLRDLLLDKKKRMKMDNLLKCEQVLVNLYAKVEQRDSVPDVKSAATKDNTTPKEKTDLEFVRNKLKTVVKLQEDAETLPEIARANDIELHYTGSKEPALFQRRPNRSSKSPARSMQKSANESNMKSPLSQHRRNYTRVLVSPEQSPRRWPPPEQSSSDKPLFSRRSPPRIQSPPSAKKEKKKSKASKSRKTKDLNITLNVPEESLNSLNTKDILSRIINCSDGDVDIDTLRELRTQILGELKQTGKNDDISDLILKSYNKEGKSSIKTRRNISKDDVEEGELSDSESEAIESIYGSLVVVDKDKKAATQVKTNEDKDNQQRKIQICLVINSDNKDSNVAEKPGEQSQQVIDLSEFEMLSENEIDKNKEIIAIDSDTSQSPIKSPNKQINENKKAKKKLELTPCTSHLSEPITVEDNGEDKGQEKLEGETQDVEATDLQIINDTLNTNAEDINRKETSPKFSHVENESLNKISNKSPIKDSQSLLNEIHMEQNKTIEQNHEISQQPKFIANFYKPIGEEQQNIVPVTSCTTNNSLPENESTANDCKVTDSKKSKSVEESTPAETNTDDSQQIPLLNEPAVPPKAKTDVLSEIDILQALKNEILSDTIAVPNSETVTPALHQPKLTKVASAHEVLPKKRISIEKYKEKASTTAISKSLFIKRRNKILEDDNSKKQSLKLTEKECERFNFPKRLSLDDDDDDLSDEDFLAEEKCDLYGLDDIYGDLAPKSPDNAMSDVNDAPPVIIPTDPVKAPVVISRSDVDMRTMLSNVSSQPQPIPQPVPPPVITHPGFAAGVPPSPVFNTDMQKTDSNIEQTNKVAGMSRVSAMDPRMRRDLNSSINSPNPYSPSNPDRTPRSTPYSNVATSGPHMTPSRNPNMTPSMTPSYMPSIPPLMTPNARSVTPSRQSFELEESLTRKHVYAPSFSLYENRERELSVPKDPHWEVRTDPRNSRRSRWEELTIPTGGPKWVDRNQRTSSSQIDSHTTRYEESYKPKYEKYNNRVRGDNYGVDRRDSYSLSDCPTTPIPSFGWSECPSTPGSAFGRQECFGRSDCPPTPIHSFGRVDCPSTPNGFGRSECPTTPIHTFGRSDCPRTPSHPFGRSEIPFSRPEISNSNQKYTKDPRLNRRQSELESNSYGERDHEHQNERSFKNTSYKSQGKHYDDPNTSRNYEREKSVGRNDGNYSSDRGGRQHDRSRREQSLGCTTSKDEESNRLYTRSRGSRYDRQSRNFEGFRSKPDQRELSVGRTSERRQSIEEARSRASSVNRHFEEEPSKDNISFKSDAGRNFTINTSVKSTFQDVLANGQPIQVFDYSFDARKKRAASVGRSLIRENSVGRTLSSVTKRNDSSNNNQKRNEQFKRASSVGRELTINKKCDKNLLQLKADFEAFRNKLFLKHEDTGKGTEKEKKLVDPRSRRSNEITHQNRKSSQNKAYSPRKNCRDPRMRKESSEEYRSRYKLDRRYDVRDSKRSGIIYSNDNIAKGTIMGSGFGVKNYKIPKLKRTTVEPEISENEKTGPEICETNEKVTESIINTKTKPKGTKDTIKSHESLTSEIKSKDHLESDNLKIVADDVERRVTRSKKKAESKQLNENDLTVKPRKPRRSVILDSESDLEPEIESATLRTESATTTKTPNPIPKSTNKKGNNSNETVSTDIEKEMSKITNDESLDSSFGMDDMDIFPENIGSDPVMENINALIADLDNDLESSKVSNEDFSTNMENILETFNSPEDTSLRDISEVIENDLNESEQILQQKVVSDHNADNKKQQTNVMDTNQQRVKSSTCVDVNLDRLQNTDETVNTSKVTYIEKTVEKQLLSNELNRPQNLSDESTLPKVNEAIVSTTEEDLNLKMNVDEVKESVVENIVQNEDRAVPDSTINKNVLDKKEDGLPDSTNDMHCELSSDVTSTFDSSETSKKESEVPSSNQKETFDSIGSLLSILKDKSKIKELLSMLGDQPSDNDKLKKKLEKLSAIVSDEEDEIEETKKDEEVELSLNKIEEKSVEKSETLDKTEKKHKDELEEKNQTSDSNKVLVTPSVGEKLETENQNTENNENQENESKSFVVSEKSDAVISDTSDTIIEDKNNDGKKDKMIEETDTLVDAKLDTKKLDDDDIQEGSDVDDELLSKKTTKKIKRKPPSTKFKSVSNKNKPITRNTTIKIQAKKPINKCSRELKKLQEDIKEMFMSDGDILNATGIRMCRLAKMTTDKESQNSGPVVVLEKVKENQDQPTKIRKKPGPKPKNTLLKPVDGDKSIPAKRAKSPEGDTKMNKPKNLPKNKPGPKSKTKQKSEETDPYEFDTDSITDTNTTKESDDDSSDSDNESLASSRSFGSSEILPETKKKRKRKRGFRWQSGIIDGKNRKKKQQRQENLSDGYSNSMSQKPITIPDLNCFTDKTYCFRKDVTTYDCRLCVYSGTDIINHYKKQHPHTEIPLSRMSPETAEIAIQQCEEINFQAISKIPSDKYTCRFCRKEFTNSRTALETFFWHIVSNHTGEFKHLCSECVNVTRCPFNLDIPPPPKDGGQLIGYICGKCNFSQISLENLKTHVIVRHNDEQTEVYTINFAVMSRQSMHTMLRRVQSKEPRVLRSLRSNQSTPNTSDYRDERSEASDDSSDRNSDTGSPSVQEPENVQVQEFKPNTDQIKAKLTFENDETTDETTVKMEQEEHDTVVPDESSHLNRTFDAGPSQANALFEPPKDNSNSILDYPHFKQNYTNSGTKEYVCCINGNDNHYKTALLISMKKHVQTKHLEKWDGYCCLCKVIVTLQGVQSVFKDCLAHFLDKHLDDFPMLEKAPESVAEENQPIPESPIAKTTSEPDPGYPPSTLPDLPVLPPLAPILSPAIPARVATPPVERTASPSYIAVRPLAELISKELVKELEITADELPTSFPKIENVLSLGEATVAPSQPSPVYPTTVDPVPEPEKPLLYEEVQAKVMSKKHRVVLDAMMSKETLVRVFKCAGRFCSFTTDSPEDALMHASTHQRVGGEGALNCAYCDYDAGENGIDLVMHVFKKHSRCQYCCPLCFYRAAASQLVGAHYKKAHVGAAYLKKVLRCTSTVPQPASSGNADLLTRDIAVQHFVCNHDDGNCNFKTYTPGKFVEHLHQKHEPNHPCNLCPSTFPTPGELTGHLRAHGLKLYQCTWCVHGANNELELLAHASARHPDKQPQAYVRVITLKDGAQRVLPLAYLNKSKVPTEDVTPSSTKENPVREAERSIDLEKLIGHTMLMMEASISQSPAPEVFTDEPREEPMELPAETLPEDVTEPSSLLTNTDLSVNITSIPSEQSLASAEIADTPDKTVENPPVVKSEPEDVVKDKNNAEIICLDSEDEEPSATAEKQPSSDINNATKTVVTEVTIQRVSDEISKSSVTEEVSITKITNESNRSSISDDDSRLNVIDLSDDDTVANTANKSDSMQIVNQGLLFKCPNCRLFYKAPNGLKRHLNKCGPVKTTRCPHKPCTTIIENLDSLIRHYFMVHRAPSQRSLSLTYCGVCNDPFYNHGGAKLHMRMAHKIYNYKMNESVDEQGMLKLSIDPVEGEPTRTSARKTSTEAPRPGADAPSGARSRRTSAEVKKRYGVEDIDKLPISPILDSLVYCELCEFGTKVRLNMVRHLQQHAGSLPVPHTAPVNPVPHLETNEKHFDKMVNLASSSVASRAPDKQPRPDTEPAVALLIPQAESARYPKYVPERQRYTCGAKDCSYISVDMAMFRCHWETLHAGDGEYRCVHCPPHQALDTSIPLNAARIIAHLRMHDVALYACSGCIYYHYRRHMVEKHIGDLHANATVRVVREEWTSEPATPPPTIGAPTMDLKAWRCGLCDFTSMLRPAVVNHCGSKHQSKMQFKCAYCPFRTSAKENVVKHQVNAHPLKAEEIFYYFYREGSVPDDENGVPRWQKQRQKLGLDDAEVKKEPEPSESAPVAPATSASVLPATLTPVPATVDLNLVKKEVSEEVNPTVELPIEDLCKKFGAFCEPDGIKFKCSLCKVVREHDREAMQCHLYEELNYRRWECVICLYKAFHKAGLYEHMSSEHSRQIIEPRALPVDVNIEKWVLNALAYQTTAIDNNRQNLVVQKIQVERPPIATTSPKKVQAAKTMLSVSDAELQQAFGEFGTPKNQKFSCPKCDFFTKHEEEMVSHLESELSKIRWGCTSCSGKFQTFHEAQFHCKSTHIGQPSRPKESIRDPSLRTGWITAIISSQRQFMKCISETNRDSTPEKDTEEDSDRNENSLLVARYDEPCQTEEQLAVPAKRPAPTADSDEERLVIDEPQKKKSNDRQCPYCDFTTTTYRCRREHILRHYNMKPYKCFYCSFDAACRQTITNHLEKQHRGEQKRIVPVEIPDYLPKEMVLTSKRDAKENDDSPKVVCLYCEKSVSETSVDSHIHGDEKPEFAKRGEVVVKCCNCLALRLTLTSLQEHFDACHPSERLNYAYFKLQVDKREILCCGHCYKKFKFLRDLKAHHAAIHKSLSLSFTSIPFNHNLHTEGDPETSKRKSEDVPGPSTKRVARKSTSKLPKSAVAKKSTTKLPLSIEEYSYYGTKPSPLRYENVTLLMPLYNTMVETDIKKLRGILNIDPKVTVIRKEYKS